MKAALSGAQAVQAGRLADAQGADAGNNNTVGISLSYGSQSSKSEQQSEQTVAKGSTLTAGNNLSIQATGSGVKGVDGDLTIQGSQIKAGNNVLLQANRDVNLVSAEKHVKAGRKEHIQWWQRGCRCWCGLRRLGYQCFSQRKPG